MIALPADVWDTLELSALVYGGIGAGVSSDASGPVCAIGHAVIGGIPLDEVFHLPLMDSGANDSAVVRVNERRKRPRNSRVAWDLFATERGWVRGA